MDESIKNCPMCNIPTFKDGGCNYMKCSDGDSTFLDSTNATNPLQNPGALADSSSTAFQLKPDYAGHFGLRTDWTGKKMSDGIVVAKTPTYKQTKLYGKSPSHASTFMEAALQCATERFAVG